MTIPSKRAGLEIVMESTTRECENYDPFVILSGHASVIIKIESSSMLPDVDEEM